jgi:hypothetical protein
MKLAIGLLHHTNTQWCTISTLPSFLVPPTDFALQSLSQNILLQSKKPYQQTNHHQPLAQMILIDQRQEKLAACCHALEKRGLLSTTALEHALDSIKVAHKVEAEDSLIHNGIGLSDDAESKSLKAVKAQSNWEDVPIGNSADTDDIQLCELLEPDSDEEDRAVDVPQAASHIMMAKLHCKLRRSLVSYFFMTLTLSMQELAYRVSFDLFRLCSRYLD